MIDHSHHPLHHDIERGIESASDPLRHTIWENNAGKPDLALINCCSIEDQNVPQESNWVFVLKNHKKHERRPLPAKHASLVEESRDTGAASRDHMPRLSCTEGTTTIRPEDGHPCMNVGLGHHRIELWQELHARAENQRMAWRSSLHPLLLA